MYYLSVKSGLGSTLLVAPLTERRIAASGQELPDCSGYFLYEMCNESGIQIIAQFTSEEAALRAGDLLNMA